MNNLFSRFCFLSPKLDIKIFLSVLVVFCVSACDETKKLTDLAEIGLNPPSRKQIDTSRMGVNNFFNNHEFGSISQQWSTIKNTLRLNHVRLLFAWTDGVQPHVGISPNFSFFDDILEAAPGGVDALIVVAHAPGWIGDSSTWIDGNPRKTWCERWFRTVVTRYAGNPHIVGYEIWNEPELLVEAGDGVLGLTDAANYMELVGFCAPILRAVDPTKLVVMAATQSIQQSYSTNLDYNRQLRDLQIENLVDIFNIHYYGEQWEHVIRSGGVKGFLNSISIPIWITESGKTSPNDQLSYVETAWPFLREEIPSIDRIYYYELNSKAPLENNYGLQTTDLAMPVSDLYVHLRDR